MDELIEVCVGRRFRVSMTRRAYKMYVKADAKARARCEKWMKSYAHDGHEFLDDTKLKHEGKFPCGKPGGTDLAILAFKAWQLRVYGGVVNGNHFVATEVDIAKKQDGADQTALKSAAKKLADYIQVGGRKK